MEGGKGEGKKEEQRGEEGDRDRGMHTYTHMHAQTHRQTHRHTHTHTYTHTDDRDRHTDRQTDGHRETPTLKTAKCQHIYVSQLTLSVPATRAGCQRSRSEWRASWFWWWCCCCWEGRCWWTAAQCAPCWPHADCGCLLTPVKQSSMSGVYPCSIPFTVLSQQCASTQHPHTVLRHWTRATSQSWRTDAHAHPLHPNNTHTQFWDTGPEQQARADVLMHTHTSTSSTQHPHSSETLSQSNKPELMYWCTHTSTSSTQHTHTVLRHWTRATSLSWCIDAHAHLLHPYNTHIQFWQGGQERQDSWGWHTDAPTKPFYPWNIHTQLWEAVPECPESWGCCTGASTQHPLHQHNIHFTSTKLTYSFKRLEESA